MFRVEAREEGGNLGKSLALQEMAYLVCDRWFGVRRQPDQEAFKPFPLHSRKVS